jgi:drug/metabolite transporter (DMT)-like permease
MLICTVLVSTSLIVGAAITEGLEPSLLTLFRFALASLLLLPYVKKHHGLKVSWATFWHAGLISIFLVVFFWCMFLALRYTSALNTSVIFTFVPGISALYTFLLVGERLNRLRWIALFCGLLGAIWVIFRGDLGLLLSMEWNKGDLIFLIGCLAMGLYTPLVHRFHHGESMVVLTFWVLVTGCGWLLLLAGYRIPMLDWSQVSYSVWIGVVYLALFCTMITFFLTQVCIPELGAIRVMSYSYLYPSLVVILEFCLGKGLPGIRTLPGVLLVLLAMFVVQKSNDKSVV